MDLLLKGAPVSKAIDENTAKLAAQLTADGNPPALALMGAGADLLRCVAESVPALWPQLCERAELLTFPRRGDVEWAQQQLLQEWAMEED